MRPIELSFGDASVALSVRRFSVRESLGAPFEIDVVARSPDGDLDLDALVGKPAALRLAGGPGGLARHLRGVCVAIEQVQAEERGLSTYEVRVAPRLALLAHRTNYRVFQHASAPEIAAAILGEWSIAHELALEGARYPKLEYRVQYGETDLAFLSRTLEEAGIWLALPTDSAEGPEVVLDDAPHARKPELVLQCVDDAEGLAVPFATRVRVARELRPARVIVRDHDFRLRADFALYGDVASDATGSDARLERFAYEPGASVVSHGASDARPDEGAVLARATRALEAERGRRKSVTFETNVLGVRPGTTVALEGHTRAEVGAAALVVTELVTTGEHDRAWTVSARAAFTDVALRPARATPKPRARGVQSAVVVGPVGDELHTDELGRVRVQFHWDRAGAFDEKSSCWVRVSQAWAGNGHGALMLPRVGQEVLVSFVDGDPDHPVVVGRVYNSTARPPYPLPASKTVMGLRSASSPGGEGFSELRIDDARGAELFYVQAERDLVKLVKQNETSRVGAERVAEIGTDDVVRAGERHVVAIGAGSTRLEMSEGKIVLSTGSATVTLEGDRIRLDAAGDVELGAARSVAIRGAADVKVEAGAVVHVESTGGDVVVQGGPMVRINPFAPRAVAAAAAEALPVALPAGITAASFDERIEARAMKGWYDPANPKALDEATAPGGDLDPVPRGDGCDAFRAFEFAVAGRAMGFPPGVLLRQAGARNVAARGASPERGDPGNGVWGGKTPYGNDPETEKALRAGFDYHAKRSA